MQLLTGTSGFSYKEWIGPFYPEKTAPEGMLKFYADRFPTVEINNTFYRMPAPAMLAGWLTQVPDAFSFTLKAPKRITHVERLHESESSVKEFLKRAGGLGERLGVVLFQLPPFFKKDLPRLQAFLDLLPAAGRFAFEFRSDSWQDAEVYDALRARGALLCVTDTDEGETPFVTTAASGYVRLRRTQYSDDELRAWAARIAAAPVERTYVYFMHEDEALGTRFAQTLMSVWDEPGVRSAAPSAG